MTTIDYSIKQLADLAGISTRTLRYYHQIGLLTPTLINDTGYRQYDHYAVDRLQKILFLKEIGLPLKTIKTIINQDFISNAQLFQQHQSALIQQRKHIDQLIHLIDQTLLLEEGVIIMTDHERFEAFKAEKIKKNEEKYGAEIRKQYGNQAIDQSNQAFSNMTPEDYDTFQALGNECIEQLKQSAQIRIPSDQAEKLFKCHKEWITLAWGHYKAEHHKGLAMMYENTPEFTAFYDSRSGSGATTVLSNIIQYYTSQ